MAELLEAWCFRGIEKLVFLFFWFWFVLLFCRLLWRDLCEFVLVMEHNPSCSMETHYELCESWLCKGIGEEVFGERRDEEKYIYMRLVKGRRWIFLGKK